MAARGWLRRRAHVVGTAMAAGLLVGLAATARQSPSSRGKMATSASASSSDGNASSTSIVRMMTLSVTSP